MIVDNLARIADALPSVRRTSVDGLAQWRFHGRLVARQLDAEHVVIRADFDYRDLLLRQFPETFSVPPEFAKHMMVVAELISGDIGAIEDAIEARRRQLDRESPPAAPRRSTPVPRSL